MANSQQKESRYPKVVDPDKIGTYGGLGYSGGGLVYDAVLEYHVWCHPERAAPDNHGGDDYYLPFTTYEEALKFSMETEGAESPLALVLQLEYIDEPKPGKFIHRKKQRITEWAVEWLSRPKRTKNTIPDFLAAHAQKKH